MNRRTLIVISCAALLASSCSDDTSGGDPSGSASSVPGANTTVDSATTAPLPTRPAPAPDPSNPSETSDPAATSASTAPQPTVALDDLEVVLEKVTEIDDPVAMAVRPGDAALYVVGQAGQVWAVRDGSPQLVLDVGDLVATDGEQGLLGLAFAPDGGAAYLYFTERAAGDVTVDEMRVASDGTFDVDSRRTLLTVEHRTYGNHNGGSLVVGPDGMLYIGVGDGGGGGDPFRAGQDLTTLLGKILRIDPTATGDQPYAVPADNPFVGRTDAKPEIWSYGLRNPWRFSFDRATGDLWVGDVGQSGLEEVDHVPAVAGAGRGANFGWSAYEGTERYNEDQQAPDHVLPVHEYPHRQSNGTIIGGFVYRGTAGPSLAGAYVFGDYLSGRVWALRLRDGDEPEVVQITKVPGLSSFGEDAAGELYALSINTDTVYRLVPA